MIGQLEHRMGSLRRMRLLSDAAIGFCLGTRALFGLDLRQTIETAASLIEPAGAGRLDAVLRAEDCHDPDPRSALRRPSPIFRSTARA